MDEIKVKFQVKNQALIKSALAGVYFLLQGDQIVFIGEHRDIKRQVGKHLKRGLKFDTIGITPFTGAKKQRRKFAQSLIRKYRPKFNTIRKNGHTKRAAPARRKKSRPGKAAKEVGLPQSRLDMIRPRQPSSPAQSTETAAAQLDQDTRPQVISSDKSDKIGDNHQNVISSEARQALVEWTKKLTEEAYEEMIIEKSAAQAEKPKNDLPDWLSNLSEEALFGNITLEQNNFEQAAIENSPQPNIDDSLPDWALGTSQPHQETPGEASADPEEKEEVPDWMSDIDMNKPKGNSVSPFG